MAALPSLRQLSYLVTLSETLHFTEAARRSFCYPIDFIGRHYGAGKATRWRSG